MMQSLKANDHLEEMAGRDIDEPIDSTIDVSESANELQVE